MATTFRLIAPDGGAVGEAGTIDEAIELARAAAPGRYRIQERNVESPTDDVRSFDWGAIIKKADGGIELELPPWID